MDIKEIDLRCSDFEAMHPVAKLFNFDHEKLTYFGDAYDDAKRLNDLWSTWCACVGLLYLETNAAKAQAVLECTWSRNEDYYFDTSCGNNFMFTECEDKPSEHQFKHCCYCGGKLIEAQEPSHD